MYFCCDLSRILNIIDNKGLHPSPSKVQVIQQAPAPTNVTELRAFLGLVNYYHKFVPNISSTLSPLHLLLRKVISGHGQSLNKLPSTKLNNFCNLLFC